MKKIYFVSLHLFLTFFMYGQETNPILLVNPNVILPEGKYPYWGTYNHLEINQLSTIEKQPWNGLKHVIEGWDWSMPDFVNPSDRSSIGLERLQGTTKVFSKIDLKFKANPTGILWVKWADIEPTEGVINFKPILDRVAQAKADGIKVKLRILAHSVSRGGKPGEAPAWLSNYKIPTLPLRSPGDNLNYNPANADFHRFYLRMVGSLASTTLPKDLRNCYVGYASNSFGDEGIGPHGEKETELNDKEIHVQERIDKWGEVFKGMETKMVMGGSSIRGFDKGFGTRRGFVEMYHYRIPNEEMGQYVDGKGYLSVDENAIIIKNKCYNGEVNEEYGENWANKTGDYRFGASTISFPYRYFMSSLRALQMRCTYIHTTGHLVPTMLPFIAQELGRTVEDTPDVWSFLVTTYLKQKPYTNEDWKNRPIIPAEVTAGIESKNFERWLFQRDAPGFETTPEEKIQHAIKMTAIQDGKNYDYIARSGKKIGFNIDPRWLVNKKGLAVKISYLDKTVGKLNLNYFSGTQAMTTSQNLLGDNKLKTVTFFLANLTQNKMPNSFDFTLEAGADTDRIVVSMVRVISTEDIKLSTNITDSNGAVASSGSASIAYYNFITKTIQVSSKNSLDVVKVFDLSGKLLKEVSCNSSACFIDANGFAEGIYIVKTTDTNNVVTTNKLIVSQ